MVFEHLEDFKKMSTEGGLDGAIKQAVEETDLLWHAEIIAKAVGLGLVAYVVGSFAESIGPQRTLLESFCYLSSFKSAMIGGAFGSELSMHYCSD
jgi:hypothetical protein